MRVSVAGNEIPIVLPEEDLAAALDEGVQHLPNEARLMES